jgi:hypothetical protein
LFCKFSIESTSDLITGNYGKTDTYTRLIYGVFTTPDNAIAGSAICAFSLQVKHFFWTFSIFLTKKTLEIVNSVVFFSFVLTMQKWNFFESFFISLPILLTLESCFRLSICYLLIKMWKFFNLLTTEILHFFITFSFHISKTWL